MFKKKVSPAGEKSLIILFERNVLSSSSYIAEDIYDVFVVNSFPDSKHEIVMIGENLQRGRSGLVVGDGGRGD
jgi:hypothetical protein